MAPSLRNPNGILQGSGDSIKSVKTLAFGAATFKGQQFGHVVPQEKDHAFDDSRYPRSA